MRKPSDYPRNVRWGEIPDNAEVKAIYKKLGLKGHNGDDYASPVGGRTFAITRGLVKTAGWKAGGYGYCVIYVFTFSDGKQYEAAHCHLSRVDVKVGDTLIEGQVVGLTGMSGDVTGPHLHFAIRRVGANQSDGYYGYEDPERFTTLATGPGKEDMWEDFVRLVYATYFPNQNPSNEVIINHANHLRGLNVEQREGWLREFMTDSDQYVTPHSVLATYWFAKGGSDPDQYADERLGGGATIASVLNGDLPTDAKALKEAKEQKAATDAALTDATNYGRKLDAKIIAQEDEIRDLHIELERTETPPADVSLNGLRLLGNYLTKLVKKEQKGGGNS